MAKEDFQNYIFGWENENGILQGHSSQMKIPEIKLKFKKIVKPNK